MKKFKKIRFSKIQIFLLIILLLLISTPIFIMFSNHKSNLPITGSNLEDNKNFEAESNESDTLSALEESYSAILKTTSEESSVPPTEITTVKSTSIVKSSASTTKESSLPTSIPTTSTSTAAPGSCPVSTQNCVPCTAGELYCRYEAGETSGYLGWACQNNNPGNVKYSDYRIGIITSMGGQAPCGEKGGFMVFSSYENCRNSVKSYISGINAGKHSAYPTCGNCSLLTFFSSYAPDSPVSYTQGIVNKMGGDVTPDTLLSWVVANRFDDFINAIQKNEGFFTQ